MPSTLYLINPASDLPTYYGCEVIGASGLPGATYMADLSTTTVAALAAPHLEVRVADEQVGPVDLEVEADWVGLTGKVSQLRRMVALARAFRERGRRVVIGGPLASLSPELLRPWCDVLVQGEIEPIASELFADLAAGRPRDTYQGAPADLATSPPPRWDLYPIERALSGTVQTSRGCPFTCDFCDVIAYLGQRQRHKPVGHVLAELDALARLGHRSVLLSDDNFTAYRSRTKELLAALAGWNRERTGGRMRLITQASVDAARDPELLDLCAQAGLRQVFVGLETPNVESLRESGKRQNARDDMVAAVHRFLEHGVVVYGGMIAGFDHDGPDIFERQLHFAEATAVPIFSVGALVAPAATPLHARLAAAGRLVPGSESPASPWDTNVVPAGMSRDELVHGLQWLCRELYAPAAFGGRVLRTLDALRGRLPPLDPDPGLRRSALADHVRQVIAALPRRGPDEATLVERLARRGAEQPEARWLIGAFLLQYAQVRHLYDQWGAAPG